MSEPPRGTVMALRYLGGETLQAIAADYGISRERVRQLLAKQGVTGSHRPRGVPFDASSRAFALANGARKRLRWAKWRAGKAARRALIARLRQLVAEVGPRPTFDQMADAVGRSRSTVAPVLGQTFIGRVPRRGVPRNYHNGWKRIRRLTGMAPALNRCPPKSLYLDFTASPKGGR